MRVGVLALQGDFEAHAKALERAGAEPVEVRAAAELATVRGLVIPGGESTTMLKLMEYYDLFEPLREFGRERPVFGTCAGAILAASEVLNPPQASLGLVDLAIERNGYGRQLDSRVVRVLEHKLGGDPELEVVLIRAPIIRRTGGTVMATYLGAPILVDYGRHLVATFHPELTTDTRVHRLFLSKLSGNRGGSRIGEG
ncbi:MAG: pyridoxal 5'-phosphate synthase glutaminase subunit PdxT [Bryobacteraceae bacterium]|jgi:5'-phosphate synthase pdxT subunit